MSNVLWHDDIRKPPIDGWLWARTNDEARRILREEDINACSLDHDLGMENEDADAENAWLMRGTSPNGSGLDLVDWMIENECVPKAVYIHSMNASAGDRMVKTLLAARERGFIHPHTRISYTPYDPRNYVP